MPPKVPPNSGTFGKTLLMGSTTFLLPGKEKENSIGKRAILLRYQKSGRKYFGTGEIVFPENWNEEKQRAIFVNERVLKVKYPNADKGDFPSSDDIRLINASLDKFEKAIKNTETRYRLDEREYTAETIINHLRETFRTGKKIHKSSDLVSDYIDRFVNEKSAIREKGSLSVYKSLKNHLINFQKATAVKVTFRGVDLSVMNQFQTYLITKAECRGSEEKGLSNTTAAKQLSTLKTFLNDARKNGVEVSDKYRDFRIKKDKLEVIALTNQEFETLYHFDLSGNKRLAQVRDIFCFSCATGLRYSDLRQLKREHIKGDEIRLTVKKTRSELMIPLNPYSRAILSRYKENHFPLPIISNQKLNKYLKELCQLAGFTEPVEIVRFKGARRIETVYPKYELIGAHTGRKTFCTLSLERGMIAEEVMRISGHENYESFKRYVNITEQRKKDAMNKAWGVISPNTPQPTTQLKAV